MIPSNNGATADGDGITKQAARNLNTILLWVLLAVLGAIGAITWNSSIAIAEMKGSLVTRAEVETKIAEVKAMYSAQQTDLIALKLALAERGIKSAK